MSDFQSNMSAVERKQNEARQKQAAVSKLKKRLLWQINRISGM